jgi:hypothetical protein
LRGECLLCRDISGRSGWAIIPFSILGLVSIPRSQTPCHHAGIGSNHMLTLACATRRGQRCALFCREGVNIT